MGISGFVQRLQHRRGHGENARVTRRNHHDRAPLGGQFEGVTGALHLFAVVSAVQHLIRAKRPGHAYVSLVTQHIIGASQLRLDRWHHQFGGARPQTNHRQASARATDQQRIQWVIGNSDGNRVIAKNGNRLADSVARQFTHIGFSLGKPQGHTQFTRSFSQRRVSHFGIRGQQASQRLHGNCGLMQSLANGVRQI
ncbi:hypothetical protein D3C81_1325820 [compost metagenome]